MGFSNNKFPTGELIVEALQLINKLTSKSEIDKILPKSAALSHQEVVSKINKKYKEENLVLVLGAGVSMSFGLPDWNTLLQNLMIDTIGETRKVSTVLSKIFTDIFKPSPLIAGRYIQEKYNNNKNSFEEAVRSVIYKNLEIDKQSKTIDEIINFCIASGKSPNLNSIITYNYDDILERRLKKVSFDVPFMPIYGIGMNPNGHLPIYHVHGFLPFEGDLSDNNQITFGESIYHKQYLDIYSWNNIVQINKFRDYNCIFIGSSLTDPNIRRLLEISKRQRGEKEESHFIFKKRQDPEKIKNQLSILLDENEDLLKLKIMEEMDQNQTIKSLINIFETFEESDTLSFGIRSIWVNDWEEVPEILKEIRLFKN